ncbi:MAG: hypothetical protein QXR45_02190 [Candidatus Bathyarchaeia archaeon]
MFKEIGLLIAKVAAPVARGRYFLSLMESRAFSINLITVLYLGYSRSFSKFFPFV